MKTYQTDRNPPHCFATNVRTIQPHALKNPKKHRSTHGLAFTLLHLSLPHTYTQANTLGQAMNQLLFREPPKMRAPGGDVLAACFLAGLLSLPSCAKENCSSAIPLLAREEDGVAFFGRAAKRVVSRRGLLSLFPKRGTSACLPPRL